MNIENKSLHIGGKVLTFGKILHEDLAGYDDHSKAVLIFLREWFKGKETFEAKTSGSTGEPKTILLSRNQMVASASLTQEGLDLHEGMTALLCLDPTLIAGKMMMVRCLVTGMHMVAISPTANPLDFVPQGLHIDFAAMVPLQASTIISSGKYPEFSSINKIILGGGAVSYELAAALRDKVTEFYATFGMTETLSHVALQKLNGADQTEYFQALKGVEFTLDERGCLVIHASHLGAQPIVSNDLVDLLSPTRFVWLGRWDNIINSGGIKIIPEQLEKQIADYFSSAGVINRFFVASLKHDKLGEEVVIVVEGDLTKDDEDSLTNHLKQSLEKYRAPKRCLYTSRFQLTTMGKIKRKETLATASPRP